MKYSDFKEVKMHGTVDFPLQFYHVGPSHPRYQMSHHWHVECEMVRVLRGRFCLMIEQKEFFLEEGDIAYIAGGELHGGMPEHCIYECLVYDLSALYNNVKACRTEMQSILNNTIILNTMFSSSHPKVHEIVWSLFEAMKTREEGYELAVSGHLYRFYGYLLRRHYYKRLSPEHSTKSQNRISQLKAALEMIEEEYDSMITLDALAKKAGMNAKYFCRFFREMTHRTPIDYLNYYRIECACLKLITSSNSITEVALSCGFNDISYFIKTFKRYKGITPKQYLKSPLAPYK